MGVFSRFKRGPEGFRALVELWESTPPTRRQRMIDIGMQEDPVFAEKALQYLMSFDDIIKMPDMEIAELMFIVPPRIAGVALAGTPEDVAQRFIRNSKPVVGAEVRDLMAVKYSAREIEGARLRMVQQARDLEKKNKIRTKKIPLMLG